MIDALWAGKPLGYSAEPHAQEILRASLLKPLIIINQSVKHGVTAQDFGGTLAFRPLLLDSSLIPVIRSRHHNDEASYCRYIHLARAADLPARLPERERVHRFDRAPSDEREDPLRRHE